MAEDTLAERDTTFNQLSESSSHPRANLRAGFQSSDREAKLAYVNTLLAQADALAAVALRDSFNNSCPVERHNYLAALHEVILAARDQLDDVL